DVRPVDQSIQPGDGGWGFLLDGLFFHRFGAGNVGLYTSASYLFNPREENPVNRFSTNPITQYFSVSHAYIMRSGRSARIANHLSGNFGVRWEGVPAEDAIGGSNGFRRPGYAVSVEPGVNWSRGNNALSFAVPVAAYRNRTRSVADKATGGHGDAAFA